MEAQQMNLDVIANNLSNVNTTGFKKSKIEFQDLLYDTTRAPGADQGNNALLPTGLQVGHGAQASATSKIFTEGELSATGAPLDIAIQGDGFFEIQMPDGTLAYTRDGAFKQSATGAIVTSDGLPVQGGFQPIATGTTSITIAPNGNVATVGASGNQSFQVQLTRFANPSGLQSIGRNLYIETQASGTPETGTPSEAGFGSLQQRYLEMSNVQVVQEMVSMIEAQRAYEVNSKAVQAADVPSQQPAPLMNFTKTKSLLAALLVVAAGRVSAGSDAWELLPSVAVDASGVYLGQILNNATSTVPTLRLAPSPYWGQTNVLTREEVIQLGRKQFPALDTTNWTGPAQVRLTRRTRELLDFQLLELLTGALQREYLREHGELDVRLSAAWTPVSVPDEDLQLKLTQLPTDGLLPTSLIGFDLWAFPLLILRLNSARTSRSASRWCNTACDCGRLSGADRLLTRFTRKGACAFR
jgi:flagellar basal-body rod protein FlgG